MRYSTSALGYLWSILDPLVMAGIYWFVFTQVFNRGDSIGEEPYIVFLLARAAAVDVVQRGGVGRDARVPARGEAHPLDQDPAHDLGRAARAVEGHRVRAQPSRCSSRSRSSPGATLHWESVYFLLGIVLQAVLTMGIGLIVAPLVVFFRDLERAIEARAAVPVLRDRRSSTASPTCPVALQFWAAFNPLSGIFGLYRAAFFPEQLDWFAVAVARGMSVVILGIGILVFRRTERAVLKEI